MTVAYTPSSPRATVAIASRMYAPHNIVLCAVCSKAICGMLRDSGPHDQLSALAVCCAGCLWRPEGREEINPQITRAVFPSPWLPCISEHPSHPVHIPTHPATQIPDGQTDRRTDGRTDTRARTQPVCNKVCNKAGISSATPHPLTPDPLTPPLAPNLAMRRTTVSASAGGAGHGGARARHTCARSAHARAAWSSCGRGGARQPGSQTGPPNMPTATTWAAASAGGGGARRVRVHAARTGVLGSRTRRAWEHACGARAGCGQPPETGGALLPGIMPS